MSEISRWDEATRELRERQGRDWDRIAASVRDFHAAPLGGQETAHHVIHVNHVADLPAPCHNANNALAQEAADLGGDPIRVGRKIRAEDDRRADDDRRQPLAGEPPDLPGGARLGLRVGAERTGAAGRTVGHDRRDMDEPPHSSLQGAPGQLDRREDVDLLHVAGPDMGVIADAGEVKHRVPGREPRRVRGRIAEVAGGDPERRMTEAGERRGIAGERDDLASLIQQSPDQGTSQEPGGSRDERSHPPALSSPVPLPGRGGERSSTPSARRASRTVPSASRR